MQQFLLRRIGVALLALFALSILTFFLIRLVDPFDYLPVFHPADLDFYKLPNPIVHYAGYMMEFLSGDWGSGYNWRTSWKWGPESGNIAFERLPNTLALASLALGLGAVLGITFGILAAIRKGTLFDPFSKAIVLIGQSMPIFWFGFIVLWIYAFINGSLPTIDIGDRVPIILPALTLAWLPTTLIARFTRSAMLSALDSDYVKLARIKGLSEWKIIWKHCFRNVAVSPLSSLGLKGGAIMTSLVLTEVVFAWPGVGLMVFEALHALNYYVLNALVLTLSGGFIIFHLCIDVFRAYLDPRIRFSAGTYRPYEV